MHANNPMCHVSMYNQILSSAAGPCGKCAKLSAMRSLKTLNKDALSSNAGHGDADGITQPNSDARCTGTEDFFQSSSNFKSEDAKTLAEARALTLLRPADTNQNQNPSVFTVHDSSNADTLNATPNHPRREDGGKKPYRASVSRPGAPPVDPSIHRTRRRRRRRPRPRRRRDRMERNPPRERDAERAVASIARLLGRRRTHRTHRTDRDTRRDRVRGTVSGTRGFDEL